MKLPNGPYRPRTRVEDIRRPSSYYQASDVVATPFTRVGQLIDVHQKSTEVTPDTVPTATSDVAPIDINNAHRPRPPIFPANFLMQTKTGFGHSPEHAATINRPKPSLPRPLQTAQLAGISAALAALGDHAVHALTRPWEALRDIHPSWAHRRYIVDRGWQVGLLENAKKHSRAIAAVGFACLIVLLLVFMRPGAPKSPSQAGNGAAGSDTYSQTSNETNATNKSGSGNNKNTTANNNAATTNGSNGASSPASSSSSAPVLSSPQNYSSVPVTAPSSSSATGGLGSGPSSTSGSTGSGSTGSSGSTGGIPGVTIPLPITVPSQSIDVGGKQVLGTSPIGVTLN